MVADVNSVLDSYDLPRGVQIEIGGSMEEQQESFSQLGLLLILVSLLVYIVLASQFESLTYPFMIILTVLCLHRLDPAVVARRTVGNHGLRGVDHAGGYGGEERHRADRLHQPEP